MISERTCEICNCKKIKRSNQKRCKDCLPFYNAANRAFTRCELKEYEDWKIKSQIIKAQKKEKKLSVIEKKGLLNKKQKEELKICRKRIRMGFLTRRDMALHIKYLYYRQERRCIYTKVEMQIAGFKGLNFSVERIEVKGRYDINNVSLCLDIVNKMKNKLTNEKEFFEMCMYVITNYIKKKVEDGTYTKNDIRSYLVSSILKHIN
ncbi:hypothetical protein [Priestia sp. LL-8]|uniref:hypothetical protein n=1 Tax=Priestia sp. LL-8 TaxID=3110068 RepID=UPI002E25B217|nr:hypothetical protein [Priestia sp. LL-8]